MSSAIASGRSETTANASHCAAYPAVEGFICEIVFRAIGMKAPGFASAAPAPTIAIAGDDATLLICATIASSRFGLRGRRSLAATQASSRAPAAMSTQETHVFGLDGLDDAATSPRRNAAAMPTASVAVSAPR